LSAWRLLVTELQATPAPRRTRAVTIAGALFLLWAVVWAFPAAVLAVPVFALVAKRRERRPDIAAVFR
jgi:hypothetical protein